MADRRALCRDLRTTAAALEVMADALGQEEGEQAEWMSHNLAATASSMLQYAVNIEAEELSQ